MLAMIKSNKKRTLRFRVIAAVSLFGLLFSTFFIVVLKKYGIYEHEYEFGRKITVIIFIASVVVPLAYYALLIFVEKILAPLLHEFFSRRHQRRIEKYGYKIVSRENRNSSRITKVLAPYALIPALSIFLCIFISAFLALGIRRLQIPEGDLSNDTVTMVLMFSIMIVSMTITILLTSYIHIRVFMKKKGVKKALKYAVVLKKYPRLLTRSWLKICGINDDDIRSYLSGMPRK